MIKINGKEIDIEKFPDGTPRINLPESIFECMTDGCFDFFWKYENNDELFYLILIKRQIEQYVRKSSYYLEIPYLPNARMDRIKHKTEVFTLKYFCEIINSLNFDKVFVLDVHSDVSLALLNNCVNVSPNDYIKHCVDKISNNDIVLYFPDAGAAKRYSDSFQEIPYCYGEKKRDWKTGKILGLEIRDNGIDLKGKIVLMIDDIIAYGGSFYYSAKELKNIGIDKIYAYATHTENSILDNKKGTFIKLLEDETVEKLFTTESLFNGKHNKIEIIPL